MKYNNLILASASPRRKELLSLICEDFNIIPSNAEEIVPDSISVDKYCEYLALLNANDISVNFKDSLIIGADTAVVIDGIILGKPNNREEAFRMLRLLSGKTHCVYTGCALVCCEKHIRFPVRTDVTFYDLTDNEIEEYIATNDPFDKAGGYGIQTKGAVLVKEIKGDYFNVVGLPIARLKRELSNFK